MSTTAEPIPGVAPAQPATPRGRVFRINSETYLQMVDAGVFGPADKLELWEGQLVAKMTKNQPHVVALGELDDAMRPLIPVGWYVSKEDPIAIDNDKVPEPDLAIVRGRRRDYERRPPRGIDVAIIVEVADSSLPKDLGAMLRAYARQAIPVYWVVNLVARRIEVHEEPTAPDRYARRTDYGPDADVPVVLDGREVGRIAVGAILPRAEGA